MAVKTTATVRFHREVVTTPVLVAFDAAAFRAVGVARGAAPFLTGALVESIRFVPTGICAGFLEATVPYASVQEFGSRPHLITPSLRLALYNPSDSNGGEFGPVAYAMHPGTVGQGFLRAGATAFPALFKEAFRRYLR